MKHILDGVYKVEYFSKSTKKKEARIIQVRNHSWTSEDGKFKNDVHVDESKGTTHVFLQNGSKQWTSWSGELPPNKLCWASNNASIGTVTWTLQGDREKVSKTTIFSTSILDAAVRCIAFCLMCSSVYHTLEIPIMFSSDVGFLSGLISSAPDFSMYKIDTISGYAVASSLNMVRCASAILLLGCGVSCPRILRGLIFAFHWYLAWSDIHVLKAAEVHGVHGDYIMIEMIQIGFFLTSVSENPRLLDFALRFLFARVMWGCGTVKLNSDWIESKKVGAITVGHAFPSHWTSQEMPSVLAFIMSKLPGQKVFTLLTLVTELTPPLFIWGSKMQRFTSCVVVSALMLGIITTGTFGVFPLTILAISFALIFGRDDVDIINHTKSNTYFNAFLQQISRLYVFITIILSLQIYLVDYYNLFDGNNIKILEKLRDTNSESLLSVGTYGVFSRIHKDFHVSISFETGSNVGIDENEWKVLPWAFLPFDKSNFHRFRGPWTFGYVERKLYNTLKHKGYALPKFAVCLMRALASESLHAGNRYGLPQWGSNDSSNQTWIRLTRGKWQYSSFEEYEETGMFWKDFDTTTTSREVVAGPVTLEQLDNVLRSNGISCVRDDTVVRADSWWRYYFDSFDHDSLFLSCIATTLSILLVTHQKSMRCPLQYLVGIQLASTLGDLLLQRAFRIEYKGSPRRALIASTVGGAIVAASAMCVLQVTLPVRYSAHCMENGELLPCCAWHDVLSSTCDVRSREPQGMFTAFDSIVNHPFLLLNGVSAVVYCLSNVLLLRHSAGQILKVNASLMATFLIAPMLWIIVPYERKFTPAISFLTVFIAIMGATLSTLTPDQIANVLCACCRQRFNTIKNENDIDEEEESKNLLSTHLKRPVLKRSISSSSTMSMIVQSSRDTLTVSLAFVMMTVSSALWACMQRYAQYTAGVNHLGFLAIDQVYSMPYIALYIVFISTYPMNRVLLWRSDREETLSDSLSLTWKQSFRNRGKGLTLIILGRVFTCVYLVGQFFVLVSYDVTYTFLEMNVMRLLISWLCTLVMTFLFPKFLHIAKKERQETSNPIAILSKVMGSVLLLCLLWVVSIG